MDVKVGWECARGARGEEKGDDAGCDGRHGMMR